MRAPGIVVPMHPSDMVALMRASGMVGLLMLAAASGARADVDASSARHVMPACHLAISGDPRDLYAQGVCVGEVVGVMDVAEATGSICTPRTVSNGQAITEVVQYIDAHPDRTSEHFSSLALEALRGVWPCPSGDPARGP